MWPYQACVNSKVSRLSSWRNFLKFLQIQKSSISEFGEILENFEENFNAEVFFFERLEFVAVGSCSFGSTQTHTDVQLEILAVVCEIFHTLQQEFLIFFQTGVTCLKENSFLNTVMLQCWENEKLKSPALEILLLSKTNTHSVTREKDNLQNWRLFLFFLSWFLQAEIISKD